MDRSPNPSRRSRRQHGVSLIELLIGVAIGLLATLVVTQVALVYEGQKRTTASGSDAQVNGALALQTLQREIQASGYGLTSGGITGCAEIRGLRDTAAFKDVFATGEDGAAGGPAMSGVIISDGTGATASSSGQPDVLRLLSSSKTSFSVPQRVRNEHLHSDTEFVIDDNANVGNAVGDLVLAVPPDTAGSWCSLFTISSLPTVTKTVNGSSVTLLTNRIVHAVGTDWPWNHDTGTIFPGNVATDVSYAAGSFLVNLGQLTYRRYEISANGVLQMRSYNSATGAVSDPVELYPNIVSLQASYGRDTDGDRQIDSWSATSPTTAAQWSQVLAIRLALVARSAQAEKTDIATTDPALPTTPGWRPDGVTREFIPVDLNGKVSDWKRYRYKVFETVVPLRNMIWQS
ncbi:MAG: hypothetical protein RJA44_2346 [Pseudomonadota bacterium]